MLPRGLSTVGKGLVDNCPAVALKDARRQLARLDVPPDELDRAAAEIVDEATEGAVATAERCEKTEYTTPMCVSRIASDRARLRVIRALEATHRPPYERVPDPLITDDTARSRLFGEIEVHFVHPIDAVADRVAGDDPPRSEDP